MAEPQVVVLMRQFKQSLLDREAGQVALMTHKWMGVERSLEAQLTALSEEIARTATSGATMTETQLLRNERYRALLVQVKREIARYEYWAEGTISAEQARMGQLGIMHSTLAIEESYAEAGLRIGFNRLPVEAVQNIVGLAGDGGPLFDILQKRALWPDAVDGLSSALIKGVAEGWGPRKTALRMADGLAEGLNKALVISRTETLRAYRTASIAEYRSSGVVTGYKRISAHDSRVCAGCLAADGQMYERDHIFDAHPQCRCSLVPVCAGVEPIAWQEPGEWFAEQPEARQREILGPGRYELWRSGKVADFRRFATTTYDETWGGAIVPTPIDQLS